MGSLFIFAPIVGVGSVLRLVLFCYSVLCVLLVLKSS